MLYWVPSAVSGASDDGGDCVPGWDAYSGLSYRDARLLESGGIRIL